MNRVAQSDFRLLAFEQYGDELAAQYAWSREVTRAAVALIAERDRELKQARKQHDAIRDEFRRFRERAIGVVRSREAASSEPAVAGLRHKRPATPTGRAA